MLAKIQRLLDIYGGFEFWSSCDAATLVLCAMVMAPKWSEWSRLVRPKFIEELHRASSPTMKQHNIPSYQSIQREEDEVESRSSEVRAKKMNKQFMATNMRGWHESKSQHFRFSLTTSE